MTPETPQTTPVQTVRDITGRLMADVDAAYDRARVECSRCHKLNCVDFTWVNPKICEECWSEIELGQKKQSDVDLYIERRNNSGLPKNYWRARYSDFASCAESYREHQIAVANRVKTIADTTGKGCLLIGPTGTGKTHLMAACANNLMIKQAVLWIDAAALKRELAKDVFGKDAKETLSFGQRVSRDFDTLFIDEFTFDKQAGYDWLQDGFQQFLNDLTAHGSTKLFMSSNNPLDGHMKDPVTGKPDRSDDLPSLQQIFKQRGTSRLIQLMHIVHLTGPNRRLQ